MFLYENKIITLHCSGGDIDVISLSQSVAPTVSLGLSMISTHANVQLFKSLHLAVVDFCFFFVLDLIAFVLYSQFGLKRYCYPLSQSNPAVTHQMLKMIRIERHNQYLFFLKC